MRQACSPWFLDFLTACEITGARPFGEIAQLTAEMIDWNAGVIEIKQHKNAKKGKTRTIFLTPPLETLLRRMVEKHPTGLLFRTRKNGKWKADAVCYHMRKMERELEIPRLNFYAYRKALITDALEKGISAEVISELVGNSPQAIHDYYNRLSERRNTLKEAAAKAIG
ncbi:hypothetical protein FRUB_09988 [Fimbriiglobus ruber]|uniref:Tyr recombinase domain-containing protein n=2 Tax=Fimbriiglobus ruber TaxID=1908690 RepID=A0A225DCV7_9BACT|nr:hypothetical protein FRUB_09988 [Fimbriiglobus ruber]